MTTQRRVLSAGGGTASHHEWESTGYAVIRLDIDPRTKPDIVGSMTDIGDVSPFDAVYCAHALEHLYPHEVPRALSEFYRVLVKGGILVIIVPNLEGIKPTDDMVDGAGCTGLHLFYGDPAEIEDAPYMAHHYGFLAETLSRAISAAGFEVIYSKAAPSQQLVGLGIKR